MFSFNLGLMNIFEYIGIASFAILGAYVAMQKRMDILGVFVLAFVTACGGGVVRDMVMNTGVPTLLPNGQTVYVPVFFSNYTAILIVLLSAIFVIFIRKMFKIHFIIVIFDAIGLSVFAIDTGMKAFSMNYNFVQFMFVSVITAVGGGVLRDILAQRVPAIFRRDIYALAAALGSVLLWIMYRHIGLPEPVCVYSSMAVVLLCRMLCVYYNINLPILKLRTYD